MATFTFGTLINPSHYIEIPDPANAGQVKRPAAGVTILVRNAATLGALTSRATTAYGYIPVFTTTDVPQIHVSADNGATWVGPLTGREAITSAITAGVDATAALSTANQALTVANAAQAAVAAGGGTGGTGSTFSGTVDWATQVTGKPTLTPAALGAIPATDRAAANGVAPLTAGLVPVSFLPVGTSSTQVAVGSHTHAQSWSGAPAGTYCKVDEISAGVYPAPPTTRADIVRVWRGSVRPTAAQGLQAGDEWRNTGAA
jgi:hypothetical protein